MVFIRGCKLLYANKGEKVGKNTISPQPSNYLFSIVHIDHGLSDTVFIEGKLRMSIIIDLCGMLLHIQI